MKRTWLQIEWLVLFIALPIGLYLLAGKTAGWIIPLLMATAVYCALVIRKDPSFDRKQLYAIAPIKTYIGGILLRGLVGALCLTAAIILYIPEQWLSFPRSKPQLWLLVMCAYPLLSVYPQEFIYRAFYFQRYRSLIPQSMSPKIILILTSALAFGWAHIIFNNWQAPVMTVFGGWMFAWTYHRSQSLLCACIEHALWGNLIFTLGLGRYFYGGNVPPL